MQPLSKETKIAKRSLLVEKLKDLKNAILTQPDNIQTIISLVDEVLVLAKSQKEVLRLSDDIATFGDRLSNAQLDEYRKWLRSNLYKIYVA